MGNTPYFELPFPDLNGPADGPDAINDLGVRLENLLSATHVRFDSVTDRDSTWAASVAPVGARCYTVDTGTRYRRWGTGTNARWYPENDSGILIMADDATRNALVGQFVGMPVQMRTMAGPIFYWTGTKWAREDALARFAQALNTTIGAGDDYTLAAPLVASTNFPLVVGSLLLVSFSTKVTFNVSTPQTIQQTIGASSGVMLVDSDFDIVDRIQAGGSGSGATIYSLVRHAMFTVTAEAFSVTPRYVVGTGGTTVTITNPRAFATTSPA